MALTNRARICVQAALATAAAARDQALKDQEDQLVQQRTDALAEQQAANDQERGVLISDHRQELEAMNVRLDKLRTECETLQAALEKAAAEVCAQLPAERFD